MSIYQFYLSIRSDPVTIRPNKLQVSQLYNLERGNRSNFHKKLYKLLSDEEPISAVAKNFKNAIFHFFQNVLFVIKNIKN